MRIFGFALVVALIVLATGDITLFIDPSCLLVLGGLVWGLVAAGGRGTGRALGTAFSRGTSDAEELEFSLETLRGGRTGVLGAGFFCTLAGLIVMLKDLDDPAGLGPGMAMGLLSFFYTIFIAYFALLPLQIGVERRLSSLRKETLPGAEDGLDLLVLGAGFVLGLVTFAVLMISFGAF